MTIDLYFGLQVGEGRHRKNILGVVGLFDVFFFKGFCAESANGIIPRMDFY